MIPQRRSQRHIGDDRTMTQKAQDLKRKLSLEDNKGIKTISTSSLLSMATEIGLEVEDGNPQSSALLDSILALEKTRNEAGSSSCNHASCSGVSGILEEGSSVSGQGGIPGTPNNNNQLAQDREFRERMD